MISVLNILLLLAAVALCIPVTVVFAQVTMAITWKSSSDLTHDWRPPVAVLVPAHNEETGIGTTLACLESQLRPGDRLVVVADNCTDNTAVIARTHGAEVIERVDPGLRGKGYALDCGVRSLAAHPPEVLVIVDADCVVRPGSIDTLARRAADSGRPVQALYLMHSETPEKLGSRISEFAWLVKNHVRPLGWSKAGLPCQLMGTGMAFPWHLISTAHLANAHLTEDMKLGIELAERGYPPLFCSEALVSSSFPPTQDGQEIQRSRWEHGHLSIMLNELPKLLLRSIVSRNLRLFAFALDLMVPPLALLVLTVSMFLLLSAANLAWSGALLPFAIMTASTTALIMAVALSWWKFGQDVIRLTDIIFALAYALGKIPLYVRFIIRKQVEWVRSERK